MVERTRVNSKRKLPFSAKAAGTFGIAFAAVGSLAPTCGGSDNKDAKVTPVNNSQTKTLDNKLPWADGQTWYLTSGPHFDGLSSGIKYALDFAPQDVLSCITGKEVMTGWNVTASSGGKVVIRGDENNPSDPSHSIVVIEDESGRGFGYMHLANIKVNLNQTVSQGDVLGNPSCEFPPGGRNDGAHLHEFAVNGKDPIDITNFTFSGWSSHSDSINYNGTMTKAGEEVRTADKRRCGTDIVCSGTRNDLTKGSNLALAPTVAELPTITHIPTLEAPATLRPAVTTAPKISKPEVNSGLSAIDQNWAKAERSANDFIGGMLLGTTEGFADAYQIKEPKELWANNLRYDLGYRGSLAMPEDISICAEQMRLGEFQRYTFTRIVTSAKETLTATDKLNIEKGLAPRARYTLGINFYISSL